MSGAYDITGGNYVSYIQAQQKHEANLDIFAEGSVMKPGTQGIYTLPNSPVTTLADLRGQTVAINAPNNILFLLTASVLAEHRVSPKSVHFASIPFPEMPAELKSAAVSAAVMPEPFASGAEEAQGGGNRGADGRGQLPGQHRAGRQRGQGTAAARGRRHAAVPRVPRLRHRLDADGQRTLAAAVALVTAVGTAGPARALSGSDWVATKLPAGYFLNSRTPFAPVSCVRHTKFCMAVTNDSADVFNGHYIGEAVLVSTDAGQTWTGYNSLPPAFFRAVAISCSSPSDCGVSGMDIHGQPEIVFTTDGGQAWTDPTPASWEDVSWLTTSIDCVAARSCWVAGYDTLIGGGSAPFLMLTKNDGASWKTFTNLPDAKPTSPIGSYALNGISCVSARSCVAVGSLATNDGTGGIATAIATGNGGITWKRTVLHGLSTLLSVSCAPGGWLATCFASGGAIPTPQGWPAAVAVSRDGGLTWRTNHIFGNGNAEGFNSISCADARHCWAAWSQSSLALDGTANGGASWSGVNSDTVDEYGIVSCLSVRVCVATTGNEFWVTSDDGGLRG